MHVKYYCSDSMIWNRNMDSSVMRIECPPIIITNKSVDDTMILIIK